GGISGGEGQRKRELRWRPAKGKREMSRLPLVGENGGGEDVRGVGSRRRWRERERRSAAQGFGGDSGDWQWCYFAGVVGVGGRQWGWFLVGRGGAGGGTLAGKDEGEKEGERDA
ncbi:hypothetical protein HAX54_016602, partial [Datura stramonium]|nr:hypothetical protein [Datura stramonium]